VRTIGRSGREHDAKTRTAPSVVGSGSTSSADAIQLTIPRFKDNDCDGLMDEQDSACIVVK